MSLKFGLKNDGSASASSLNSIRASSRTVSSYSSRALVTTATISGSSGMKSLVSLRSAIDKKFAVAYRAASLMSSVSVCNVFSKMPARSFLYFTR